MSTFNFAPTPPKILKWSMNLNQHYTTDQKILLTSGCSFTASTTQLDYPASWPGYVLDRCGFDYCVDLSYPGVGNEYITNSVLNYIEALDTQNYTNVTVVVCWSGPERKEEMKAPANVTVDNVPYHRVDPKHSNSASTKYAETWRSWKNITLLQNYLENKKIKFGFALYANVITPSAIPRRDLVTTFEETLSQDKVQSLQHCNWLHRFEDSFFEYCFFNDDCLSEDMFHPNAQGSLLWTDQVLLPGMLAKNLIVKL